MARADLGQAAIVSVLRQEVIEVMSGMARWADTDLRPLLSIRLGVLRKDSTQRHGVTRWKQGTDLNVCSTDDVEVIDLHPAMLEPRWWEYARSVLFHEFLHAQGMIKHDSDFRAIESEWPRQIDDEGFTDEMRLRNAVWIWRCKGCDRRYPRRRRSSGRFRCKSCLLVLVDEVNTSATRS